MITRETIARILDSVRIEEVVGEFVSLKRKGKDFASNCPFHNEKTPSFYVSPVKGIYKCFGCGKAGNAVTFLMEHERYTYPEALKYLAGKYNIEIEETIPSEEDVKKENEIESIYLVNSFAQKHFSENLLISDEGISIGLSYFKERGFSEETVRKFQLGYSLKKQDAFTGAAIAAGYKSEFLEKAGLTGRNGDFFHERVIFPIHNLTGRVIAFGGRTLKKDPREPKYINSPETDIYNKSRTLYGIFFAKKSIVSSDMCYLVEGYTDVMSLHQSGIENSVSSSGTSLTVDQLRLIKRYTQNLTILYDGDPAGIKASLRGIDLALEEGLSVRVVLLPEGEDPDSYSNKVSSSELRQYVTDQSTDFIRFKARLLLQEIGNDPSLKAKAIKDIVASIALIPDGITRTVYIKECGSIMNVPEEVLNHEVFRDRENRFRRQAQDSRGGGQYLPDQEPGPAAHQPIASGGMEWQERAIIRLLLNYGTRKIEIEGDTGEKIPTPVSTIIVKELRTDGIGFENPVFNEILRIFTSQDDAGTIPDENFFTSHTDIDICTTAIELITTRYKLSDWEKRFRVTIPTEETDLHETVFNALHSLKEKLVKKMIRDFQEKLKNANSDEEFEQLLIQDRQLQEVKSKIATRLGRVII